VQERHDSYSPSGPQPPPHCGGFAGRGGRLGFTFAIPAAADAAPGFGVGHDGLTPGNLLVTTGVWTTNADITAGTTQLPPNCAAANPAYVTCGTAVAPGTYPIVFNNDASDASFGVTEPIVLDELNSHNGHLVKAVTVPDNPADGDYLTTSFSSKSELQVIQSTDGRYDTFVGYVAAPGTIDASNANTPGEIDPTIADSAAPTHRAVAELNAAGRFEFTETNARSAATTAWRRSSTPRTGPTARSSPSATLVTAPTRSWLP
jgi:hypothetical protein